MITLYRMAECAACDDVQETLRELVVAHKVIDVEKEGSSEASQAWANRDLPLITDGDQVVSGQAAVQGYLAELTHDLEEWRKYQTDACYVDDKGKTC